MNLLLLGTNGQLGLELQRSLSPLGKIFACNRNTVDFNDLVKLKNLIRDYKPDIIINAVAYTDVDKAESDEGNAFQVNSKAVDLLAQEAKALDAWLVHYSTDYVFDGEKMSPYTEEDKTNPLSIYGKTKLQGEDAIKKSKCKYIIFRTSWLYATIGKNFIKTIIKLAKEKNKLKVVSNQIGAPTSAELVADVTSLCLYRIAQNSFSTKEISGIYNLSATGKASWYDFAKYVIIEAQKCGGIFLTNPENIIAINASEYVLPAKRPANSLLDTQKLCKRFNLQLPVWQIHVDRAIKELYSRRA
tara:strand:+ start:331 stop:1233 length:903 start_codon:yes stop_codon:yes gene_type:complete